MWEVFNSVTKELKFETTDEVLRFVKKNYPEKECLVWGNSFRIGDYLFYKKG